MLPTKQFQVPIPFHYMDVNWNRNKKKKDNHTGLERHDGADSLKW